MSGYPNDLKILLVGVRQDGLVHINELANRFVSDPAEVVKLHQHVKVKVLEVDIPPEDNSFFDKTGGVMIDLIPGVFYCFLHH